jgi:hypothetical protein
MTYATGELMEELPITGALQRTSGNNSSLK